MLFNSAWQFHWSNNNEVIVNESKTSTLGLKIDAEKCQEKKKKRICFFIYLTTIDYVNFDWYSPE